MPEQTHLPFRSYPAQWTHESLLSRISFPNGQINPQLRPYRDWPLIAPDHIEQATGRLLTVRTAAQQNAISGKYAFHPGDVLYSKIRPYLRKAVLADRTGLCSADMYPLRPNADLHPKFLLAVVLSEDFSRFATAVSMRSGFPKINREELAEYKVAFPPYGEQARIAEILYTADVTIQQTEALISKMKQTKTGLLHDLLTRGIERNGRVRTSRPQNWSTSRFINHISLPSGQVDPRNLPYRHWPLIAPDHIEQGTGRLIAIQTADEQSAISGKYAFQPGDVLYSKIRPYLRKAALATSEGLCSADMYPFRPGPDVHPTFLLAIVLGEEFSRFATTVSMRSGIPKLNREELSEFQTNFPPLEEQHRIVAILDAHNAKIRAEEAYFDKLKLIKQGLMQDLLTGKVRVKP